MSFTNILFPVDFSERSHAVVPYVMAVRERFKASLTLLHLIEIPAMAYGVPEAPAMFDFKIEEMKDGATQALAHFAQSRFPGTAVNTVVDVGDPGACIGELARFWGMDLIMLPTRGCDPFRVRLLGSVTARTLHDATCAVWTDAHCEANTVPDHTEWRSVICAIDTVSEGTRLIHFASELAYGCGAKVRLAHAVPTAEAGPERYFDMEFTAFLKTQAREKIAAMQREAGTDFDLLLGAGNVADVVRDAAENHNADLVVIGRGALPHFAGRLRLHAYSIVRDMPCPVLSV